MAGNNPIGTLEEAKAWLGELSPPESVELGSSRFATPLAGATFDVALGEGKTIELTVTAVDKENAQLTAIGAVLGEEPTEATLVFSEPAGELCCQLDLKPPPSVKWMLPLSLLEVPLVNLEASFSPNLELDLITLDLRGEIRPGAADKTGIQVEISLPTFAGGDWHLRANTKSIGALGADALEALAGGSAEAQALVELLSEELGKFELTGFEAAFDPTRGTCALIRIEVEYKADWKFFEDRFRLENIRFELTGYQPTSAPVLQAALSAEMEAAELPFEVGGRYPDLTVYGRLPPSRKLELEKAFAAFAVPLPEGFPDIDVSTLGFFFFLDAQRFEFRLGLEEVELVGDAKFDLFLFDLEVDYGQAFSVAGSLYSELSFGKTTLRLGGRYSTGGLRLEGAAEHIPVGELIAKLSEDFGVESVPAPLEELELTMLAATVDTGAETFSFECSGTTRIGEVEVTFEPKIDLAWGNTGYAVDFGGKLVLETENSQGEDLKFEFAVDFESSPNSNSIAAGYKGKLSFADLAAALGFEPVEIPEALDLELEEVDLIYDFKTGGLAIGAKSESYGRAVLASLTLSGKREFFFVLDAGREFSLSDLPLVGEELNAIEEITISDLETIVATRTVDAGAAASVNREIELLKKQVEAEYPTLPAKGTKGKVVFSAALRIGAEERPLELSLAGGSSRELPAVAGAAGSIVWIDIQKSFGPFSIKRIGAMYQSETQVLWFELDAGMLFGPLSLSLDGLGIGSPLDSFDPSFDLRGLGVSYRQPPLEISGGLTNLAPPGSNLVEFQGGIVVGTPKFKLQALGYYGNTEGFTSMFVFGSLDYPLGGPPAFFVTGLALGFGYNSSLRLPAIEEVEAFPLVAALPSSAAKQTSVFGPNPTPNDVLDYMRNTKPPWVAPRAESLWFAAGITFTSFELIEGEALVVVETGEELVIALIGTAGVQFPQAKTKPPSPYANVELNILVRLAPDEGVFSAQALLAKSSYVLDRACVLTGGFAFFVWFGKNVNKGDFVLTLGGYNPGFVPPAHYPKVPAVGFRWSVDNTISISGSAYLTVTPAVLMAGARLDAVYRSGALRAWFSAHADVLIRWKPFWIEAGIGVVVGVSYKIDLWFTTKTVSVELGCNLELWGPPTGGRVKVDWYIISFTIPFGASRGGPERLRGWVDFEALLPSGAENAPGKAQVFNPLSLAPVDGLAPGPPDGPWPVRPGAFAFEVTSPIPMTGATVGDVGLDGDPFNVHPLGWKNVSSTCTVTVEAGGKDLTSMFEVSPLTRNLPASLWGSPPETNGRPTVPDPAKQLVPDQLVGASLRVRPPTLGASAGPVDVEANLYGTELELAGALLPLSKSAKPSGEVALAGEETAAIIADPATGIAAPATRTKRTALYDALLKAGYVAPDSNERLDRFAAEVDGAFATEPLVVK